MAQSTNIKKLIEDEICKMKEPLPIHLENDYHFSGKSGKIRDLEADIVLLKNRLTSASTLITILKEII